MTTSDCIREALEEETPPTPPEGQDLVVDDGIYVIDGGEYVTDTL